MADKIGDLEIKAIVEAEVRNSLSFVGSDLSSQRAENIEYYLSEPFGNELEGRSSVVSSDVSDTIEWILPQLIRIFASGDETVSFDPTGPEDVEIAAQATDYANYVWDKDNAGFLNYYTWFKDALLTKNGTIKVYWDEKEKVKKERYEELSDEQFAEIVSPDDVEVLEHTERTTEVLDPQAGAILMPVHDVVLSRTMKEGRVRIDPVPPEEFLIDRDAKDIQTARFVAHRRRRTLADLVDSGFELSKIENLSSDDSDGHYDNEEEIARDTVEDEGEGQSVGNKMMRTVWVVEGYLKIDVEGNGKAEMRQITAAGAGATILKNEAWEGPVPFCSITPVIMPHRFYGRAIADLIKDLQLIKSTILRQYLDNLYIQNNAREQVDADRLVEPQEALSTIPGQKIRVKNLGSQGPAVMPIPVADIGAQALTGLEYIDKLREQRTGVSERTQGLQADTLHDTFGGEQILMTAALAKIELIARVFAETGVRDAFRQILYLITQYQDQERVVRLRSEWVPMDPSSWNPDMDVTVSVGLGTGDKQQQMGMGLQLLGIQKEALANGFAEPKHLLETAEIIVNSMGFKGVDRFFSNEEEIAQRQQGQQQQSPEMMKVQAELQQSAAKLQMEQQKLDAELQMKSDQFDKEIALKERQLVAELSLKRELAFMGVAQGGGVGNVNIGGEPG